MPEDTSSATATGTASWTDPISTAGDNVLENVEGGLGTVAGWIRGIFDTRPFLGAAVTGGLGLSAVMAVGVGEVTFTLVVAYVGYRVFAYGETLSEAVEKSIEFRQGKRPTEGDKEP
ncbi:MAG: hypothetical protein HY268_06845 [Deltaproteobacteria bacterium]|nr:hypothetical protein [Deltaproteobacteria bacterium]